MLFALQQALYVKDTLGVLDIAENYTFSRGSLSALINYVSGQADPGLFSISRKSLVTYECVKILYEYPADIDSYVRYDSESLSGLYRSDFVFNAACANSLSLYIEGSAGIEGLTYVALMWVVVVLCVVVCAGVSLMMVSENDEAIEDPDDVLIYKDQEPDDAAELSDEAWESGGEDY